MRDDRPGLGTMLGALLILLLAGCLLAWSFDQVDSPQWQQEQAQTAHAG